MDVAVDVDVGSDVGVDVAVEEVCVMVDVDIVVGCRVRMKDQEVGMMYVNTVWGSPSLPDKTVVMNGISTVSR